MTSRNPAVSKRLHAITLRYPRGIPDITNLTMTTASASQNPTLRRLLGKWDLTAIGINQVIGGAVFLMPSQVAAQVGNWSPIAFLLAGFASMLVALCFAEAGRRFGAPRGPSPLTPPGLRPFPPLL